MKFLLNFLSMVIRIYQMARVFESVNKYILKTTRFQY